jgi:hypothetical protein
MLPAQTGMWFLIFNQAVLESFTPSLSDNRSCAYPVDAGDAIWDADSCILAGDILREDFLTRSIM